MMKQFVMILSFVFLLVSCGSGNAPENIFSEGELNSGPVIVDVDGIKIHQGFLDVLSRLNPRVKSDLANPLTRTKLINSIVDQQLLYQEALNRGVDGDNDIELRTLLTRHSMISNALVEKELTDAMKKTYEEQKNEKFTKVNVSLLAANFLPQEDKKDKNSKDKTPPKKDPQPTLQDKQAALDRIKKIKQRLSQGEDFAKIAEKESDDKMTAKKSGVAGQISKDDARFNRLGLKEVTDAAFKLSKDQVSEPIETSKGYYLVKITSDPIITPMEEAERVLRFELQTKIKDKLVAELRKNAKINFADSKNSAPAEKRDTSTAPTPDQTNTTPSTVPVTTPIIKQPSADTTGGQQPTQTK